jgi:hypothetical protein
MHGVWLCGGPAGQGSGAQGGASQRHRPAVHVHCSEQGPQPPHESASGAQGPPAGGGEDGHTPSPASEHAMRVHAHCPFWQLQPLHPSPAGHSVVDVHPGSGVQLEDPPSPLGPVVAPPHAATTSAPQNVIAPKRIGCMASF